MNKKYFLILILLIFLSGNVLADKLTFKLNQSEYYFLVGENAVITLYVENNYGKEIDGILKNSLSSQINQGGVFYSNQRSESQSIKIVDGNSNFGIGFGSSNVEAIYTIKLSFDYFEKKDYTLSLNEFKIHFVNNPEDKKNEENSQESNTEKNEEQKTEQENQPSTSQKSQDNQMNQDSSALKQEIQQQLQKKMEEEEKFKQNLANNQILKEENEILQKEGFNISNTNFNVKNETSGDFKIDYKDTNGNNASLSGKMENGNITNLQKTNSKETSEMLDKLMKDERFREFNKSLTENDFELNTTEIKKIDDNKTEIKIKYFNEENESSIIKAVLQNNEIKEVKLEKQQKYFLLFILFFILIFGIIGFIVYKKIILRNKKPENIILEKKTLDYKKESKKILELAIKFFKDGKEKESYGIAAHALRFFLIHKNNLDKELTNEEVIKLLKKDEKNYRKSEKCFDLCSLVSFAKYKPNKKDFKEIIDKIKEIIEQ